MPKPRPASWLLLLYGLPARRSSERVSLWRRLRKFGALPLKTSAYVLPDEPAHYERFQWLVKQIQDDGGEATLVRLTEIEGMPDEKLVQAFQEMRAKDYAELTRDLSALIRRSKKGRSETFAAELEKLQRRFREIQEVDFFGAPAVQNARMLLQQAERVTGNAPQAGPVLKAAGFRGREWLTRPRPGIDRVGCAWLIKKFIDPEARFVFAPSVSAHPRAVPYDMVEAEFSHHGDDCSFETLVKRFALKDKTLRTVAEMVHDADLEDGKFQRNECLGLNRILKGWARMGLADQEIFDKGFACFEALYASAQR